MNIAIKYKKTKYENYVGKRKNRERSFFLAWNCETPKTLDQLFRFSAGASEQRDSSLFASSSFLGGMGFYLYLGKSVESNELTCSLGSQKECL